MDRPFLLNVTASSPGDDVADFGDLSLKRSTYQSSSDDHVGNAKLTSVVYASQGSLQDPKMDPEGKPLVEPVGTAIYRGTWSSSAYEGNTGFDLGVHCESIDLTVMRPDLQAVCGAPGFDADVYTSCERPAGATTIQCPFGANEIVFTRL